MYEATHLLALFGSGTSSVSLSSRLWSTVSKVAVRSKASSRVRLQGFFWLRPFCMLMVTMSRAVVVECSGLKPCWCSFSKYSIKSLSSSSVNFAVGERSAIDLKLFDSSIGSPPPLCRGVNRPTFQMFGIFALFTERFMLSVRYLCYGA